MKNYQVILENSMLGNTRSKGMVSYFLFLVYDTLGLEEGAPIELGLKL